MLEFISVVLILVGGAIFMLAFKRGYQKIGPIIFGSLLIAAGFYLLPTADKNEPDIYYRQ